MVSLLKNLDSLVILIGLGKNLHLSIKMPFFCQMDEIISFEDFLFGVGNKIFIDDMEFCVNRIVILPKIRPHQLDKAVNYSIEYCQIADFQRKLLEQSYICPVLIYQLYKRGVLKYEEIEPFFANEDSFLLCNYFWKEIKDFKSFIKSKSKPYGIDESFFKNTNDIDQLIEYGYLQTSIEYCLKNDVIDDLAVLDKIGKTPLHCAAIKGHFSVVEYLVRQKADINAKDRGAEFLYLIGLLFIMLLDMVILMLLNI